MKTKKIIFTLGVFAIAFLAAHVAKIYAGTSENTSGWAWGGSNDGNVTGKGIIPVGVGAIAMNNLSTGAGGSVNYGLNIPDGDGPVTGYAWSSNVGWIDFSPHSGCPGSPKYAGACKDYPKPGTDVMRVGNNLTGWARFVEISKADAIGNAGGYDGWIRMDGPMGVTVSGNTLSGNAWSGDLGAIAFNGGNTTYNCTGFVDVNSDPCGGAQQTGLVANVTNSYGVCDGVTKCQRQCKMGFGWNGSACVPGSCDNDLNPTANYLNTEMCGSPQNVNISGGVPKTIASGCDGSTKCQHKCIAGFTFYNYACLNCTIGNCGSAENGGSVNAPTTNLCDSGAASTPQLVNNNWTWTCGTCGGGASCSVSKIYDIDVKDWKEVSL